MVNGEYIVEVRTHSYNNPQSLLANGNCCDMLNGHSGVVPGCDNVFYYYLRPIGSYSSGTRCHGGMLSHGVNNDDAPLNFSGDTVLGLPNPLPLLGPSAQWTVRNYRICLYLITAYINMHTCSIGIQGVQFYLEVTDQDDGELGTGDFVGRVAYNISSDNITLGVETEPRNFSYKEPPVRSSIVLSFKVVCATGYTGESCDVNIDDCQAMAINCSGRGECFDGINNFTCECNTGYTGKHCEVEIDKCGGLNTICSGNGQCVNDGNSYRCVCDPNFTGETCSDKNINKKAILGGAIGALVLLVVLLLLTVGALAFKLSTKEKKKKGE